MGTAAHVEREALSDLFTELGPDVPTLCEGWTARDLAAHLVVRERRPDGAVGIVAKPLAGYADKVRRGEAERPWDEIVQRVRSGPPMFAPTRIDAVDRAVNTIEYFVHHEDVRRAQPGWTRRELTPDLVADLTAALSRMARVLARKVPVGVVLNVTDAPDGPRTIVARKGDESVTISGPIGEITLYVYGRRDVAGVELDGSAAAVEQLRAASFGI
jgi:uncharacterized protein (TIGR03085 family)